MGERRVTEAYVVECAKVVHGLFPAKIVADLAADLLDARAEIARLEGERDAMAQRIAAGYVEAEKEIDRLTADRDSLRRELGDLLAIIHRDGGHHTEAVGTAKSVEDAHQVWASLRRELEEARANERLNAARSPQRGTTEPE